MALLRSLARGLAALVLMAAALPSLAEPQLYAATVRSRTGPGDDAAGNLYLVDPSDGSFRSVGPLRLQGRSIGITGLAVHPKTGVLYGVTAGSSPNYRNSLVTIDPATAEAAMVGEMRVAGSDVTFNTDGELFMWLPDTNQIGRINLASGRVTPIGEIGESTRLEGGIAFDGRGKLYVAPSGATGMLELRDPATGAITPGPMLANAPYLSSLNSLAVSPRGEIFGVNSNMGSPAHTALVKLDPHNGMITQVGPLPEDTDCLAFIETPRATFMGTQTPANIVLFGTMIVAAVLGCVLWLRSRRRRRAPASA